MFPAPFAVVLDANVLYPFTLRDTLLRLAAAGFFQVHWSAEILQETTRNLVANVPISEAQAHRLIDHMNRHFPEANVTGYEPLVASVHNHVKDRHVVAAAVRCAAQLIVTSNLKDFEPLPEGMEAVSPDAFLCSQFDLDRQRFVTILEEQAADLQRPTVTVDQLLARLERVAPTLVRLVREHLSAAGA